MQKKHLLYIIIVVAVELSVVCKQDHSELHTLTLFADV